jgi:hypothetical protein
MMQGMPRASLLFGGLLCAICAQGAAADNGRPEDVLVEKYGLAKLASTNIWILPAETELRDLWADLGRRRDAAVLLEQALSERMQRNARDWIQVEKKDAALRLAMATLDPRNREARVQFETQIAANRSLAAPPDRLGQLDDVREQISELAGQRTNVWLTAQAIRRQTPLVVAAYQQLMKDERVAQQVKKVGANHRLGPARNYPEDLKKLGEFERIYQQDWVPLLPLGDRLRFTAVVNDTTPITFTWVTSSEPATLTASMAEAAGIKAAADADTEKLTLADKTYTARKAIIPYLRLGRHEKRDVPVLILPPEAEFAGARLGPSALAGLRVEPQPDRLRLVVTSTESQRD